MKTIPATGNYLYALCLAVILTHSSQPFSCLPGRKGSVKKENRTMLEMMLHREAPAHVLLRVAMAGAS